MKSVRAGRRHTNCSIYLCRCAAAASKMFLKICLPAVTKKPHTEKTRAAFLQYPPLLPCVSSITTVSCSVAMTTSYTEQVLIAVGNEVYVIKSESSWIELVAFLKLNRRYHVTVAAPLSLEQVYVNVEGSEMTPGNNISQLQTQFGFCGRRGQIIC